MLAKLSFLNQLKVETIFLVKINEELNWTLCCHGSRVEVDSCPLFSTIPNRFTSISVILNLLAKLDVTQICQGSPVKEFQSLVDVRGGVFMDSTGMCT